jgi:diguanylate cyclase (GGDEF)-like protein
VLALTAIAIFPLAGVSYVVVRDEVGNVTQGIEFELHDAAVTAQAQFAELLNKRELNAVAAASSPRLQRAIRRRSTNVLEKFAQRRQLVLQIGGRRYGTPIDHAVTARVRLTLRGRAVGSVVAQLPLDAATLQRMSAPIAAGVRLAFAAPHATVAPGGARSVTQPLAQSASIRAYLPRHVEAARTAAAYRRVEAAGLLAVLALMLLAFVLARPLLRALRWTEERAGEARVDVLTGVANRRALVEVLAAETSRAERFGHALSVVILDLDHFKQTNDLYGHAAGDELLRMVGGLLAEIARKGDTVARLGGEEFVAVLPETDLDGARRLAERLRLAIENSAVGEMRTTASFGVAAMLPDDTADTLLDAADGALYQAKRNGRNRTESAVRKQSRAVA